MGAWSLRAHPARIAGPGVRAWHGPWIRPLGTALGRLDVQHRWSAGRSETLLGAVRAEAEEGGAVMAARATADRAGAAG
jgi:hypothetical protein